MLPSPSELQYFIEVANTGNITRASERLGVTQPSLSLALKRLEENLRIQLFVRSKNGVQLTAQGKKLQKSALQLLQNWEKLRSEALELETEIQGRFTIGCHPSVARYSLPTFMTPLLTDNPHLEITLKHDLSRKITEEVISFGIDFGIVVNPIQHPDLIIKELLRDEVTLWTTTPPSSLQQPLKKPAVLICDPNLIQTQGLRKKLSRKNYQFTREMYSTSLEVITRLVACGAGVGILPTRVAQLFIQPKLKPLSSDTPTFQDRICLIYRVDAPRTAATKYIIKMICENLK